LKLDELDTLISMLDIYSIFTRYLLYIALSCSKRKSHRSSVWPVLLHVDANTAFVVISICPLNDSQGGAAVFAVVVEEHPDDVGSRADVGKVKLRITT
jgi:hypothetical protein